MSLHKTVILLVTLLLLTVVSSCSLLEQSQNLFEQSKKLVFKGSSGKISEPDDSLEIASRSIQSAHSGPVLAPPTKQSVKNDSVNLASGKAVKTKRQKKKGSNSSSSVSKKELDAARKDVEKNSLDDAQVVNQIGLTGDTVPVLAVVNQISGEFSIAGDWTIYSVRNNIVDGEERPYINFDLKNRRFYGTNGCNYINGDLDVSAKGQISLDNIISTQKLCSDVPFEHLINLALSDVSCFAIRQDGSVTYLDLLPSEGDAPLIVLKRLNMDFLNGAWRITAINGTPMTEEASITIDVIEHRIHGNTGCNIFNGDLFIDPDKHDSMQFCNLISTRMSCPENVRETELLLALEEAESARPVNQKEAEIFSVSGALLLTLERIDLQLRDEPADSVE